MCKGDKNVALRISEIGARVYGHDGDDESDGENRNVKTEM